MPYLQEQLRQQIQVLKSARDNAIEQDQAELERELPPGGKTPAANIKAYRAPREYLGGGLVFP